MVATTTDTTSSSPPSGPLWDGHFTPEERTWVRRAAFLRAHGHEWQTIANKLNVSEDILLDRIEMYHLFFRQEVRYYERENIRHACREACMILRSLLRSNKPSQMAKAADLIVRLEMNRYRHRPRPCRCSTCRRTATTSTASTAAPRKPPHRPFIPRDKPKAAKKRAPSADPILQCFPNTAKGRLARDIYLQAQVMTHEQMAAKWEDMFRRECFKRRITIPGVEFQEYWLKEGYDGDDAVGWDKNDPVFQVYLQLRRQGVVDYHTIRHKIAELCGADAANVYDMREKCRMLLHTNWGRGVGRGPKPQTGSADGNNQNSSDLTNSTSSPSSASSSPDSSVSSLSSDGQHGAESGLFVGDSVGNGQANGATDTAASAGDHSTFGRQEKPDRKAGCHFPMDIYQDLTSFEERPVEVDNPASGGSGGDQSGENAGTVKATRSGETDEVKRPECDKGDTGDVDDVKADAWDEEGEGDDLEADDWSKEWDEEEDDLGDEDEPDDDPDGGPNGGGSGGRGPRGGDGRGPRGGSNGGGRGGSGSPGGGRSSRGDSGRSGVGGRGGRGGRGFDPSQYFRFGIIDIGPRNEEKAGGERESRQTVQCARRVGGTSEKPERITGELPQRSTSASIHPSLETVVPSPAPSVDLPGVKYLIDRVRLGLYRTKWRIDSGYSPAYPSILGLDSLTFSHLPVLLPRGCLRKTLPMAALGLRVSQSDLLTQKGGSIFVSPPWQKALWIVSTLFLWGWGMASSAQAGCGDHFPMVLNTPGTYHPSFPWTTDGEKPDLPRPYAPCPGPGCSPGPGIPPLSLPPPMLPTSSKPLALALFIMSAWQIDDSTGPVWFHSTPTFPQGASSDIFHPPRQAARSC